MFVQYRYMIQVLSLILCFSCNQVEQKHKAQKVILQQTTIVDNTKIDSVKLGINFKPEGKYDSIINSIFLQKTYFNRFLQENEESAIDSASVYLKEKLLNDIIPHWYGTVWDFNGHTNTPNNGDIACGYFVSTTLKHLGFNLNRYKMAQQAGLLEAQMLQPKSELKTFSNLSFEALNTKVNSVYNDGIYFVGLDNHVGYLFIKNKELYFIHSSYCDNEVVIERAKYSACFQSNFYVFAEITSNRELIKKWILNKRLLLPDTF